jgi:hypothetical protein
MGAHTRKTRNVEPISMSDGTPANLNMFGQRICDSACPLFVDVEGHNVFCEASLDYVGHVCSPLCVRW